MGTIGVTLQPGQSADRNAVRLVWCLGDLAFLLHGVEALPHALVHPRSVVRIDHRDEGAAANEPDAVIGYVAEHGSGLRSATQERQNRLLPPALAGPPAALLAIAFVGPIAVPQAETLRVDLKAGRPLLLPPPTRESLDIVLL